MRFLNDSSLVLIIDLKFHNSLRYFSITGRSSSSIGGLRSYFRMVSEHKEIVRSVMALQGMMYMYKPDIEKLLKVRRQDNVLT